MNLPDGVQGFYPGEVDAIINEFVCAVCYRKLMEVRVEGAYLSLIVCPEHGNIEICGRVTKNTVSIEMERAKELYYQVIRNLPDLWGELIREGFLWDDGVRIARDARCSKCGNPLYPVLIPGDREHVGLMCQQHGNIDKNGYSMVIKNRRERQWR